MHTHTHTHIQAYTHTYIYTHIHTHTHILYIFVHRRPLLSPLSADNDTLRQADVSGKTLRTTAIKAEISNTMRTISTLSVVRVNTRKRSSSAKENRQRSKRGSARVAPPPPLLSSSGWRSTITTVLPASFPRIFISARVVRCVCVCVCVCVSML